MKLVVVGSAPLVASTKVVPPTLGHGSRCAGLEAVQSAKLPVFFSHRCSTWTGRQVGLGVRRNAGRQHSTTTLIGNK